MNRIIKALRNPYWFLYYIVNVCGLARIIPDRCFLQLQHRCVFGVKLDLKNPVTFNEKLQWLKLNNRKPEYSIMVDKCESKKYVAKIIGEQYIIPTLGVWDSFDEIDFNVLPDQFVLKCTHDSGSIVICKDKSIFDITAAEKIMTRGLKRNIYWAGREYPYRDVKPRIIAEQYMVDESNVELKDYKIFNFNAGSQIIQVDYGRFTKHLRCLHSDDWTFINVAYNYPPLAWIASNLQYPSLCC